MASSAQSRSAAGKRQRTHMRNNCRSNGAFDLKLHSPTSPVYKNRSMRSATSALLHNCGSKRNGCIGGPSSLSPSTTAALEPRRAACQASQLAARTMRWAYKCTKPRSASSTATSTSANGGLEPEPAAGGCKAPRRHHEGNLAPAKSRQGGGCSATLWTERWCSRRESGDQPALSAMVKGSLKPRVAAKRRTRKLRRPAATCKKVWPLLLRCNCKTSGMRSKSITNNPPACGVNGCMPLTKCSKLFPLRAWVSPKSTPFGASGGKCRKSSKATSVRWNAQASQKTEWPRGSRVRPETKAPCWMISETVPMSPSTTARHSNSGGSTVGPETAAGSPLCRKIPCKTSVSSCNACWSKEAMPRSCNSGLAMPALSNTSRSPAAATSGRCRSAANAWSNNADTIGAAPRARLSRPSSIGSGPRANAQTWHHAANKSRKAVRASPAPAPSPPMTRFATISLFCHASRQAAASRICPSTCLGHATRSKSASARWLQERMSSAVFSICWSSAGCKWPRARASSTRMRKARASGATSSNLCCKTAPRACGNGPRGACREDGAKRSGDCGRSSRWSGCIGSIYLL
mmetsp:Transcript_3101/g.9018  ORF Transcript_3101/g.9018 Transcript_3101/m.9018 type:complete len:576 (+) Transcript_3101:509-2236(+)